jgi:glycosyltransferase involved in cell wall biosynthesis
MTEPKVTVTMPAFDAEATIAGAVATVLGQTFGDLELVVVDDGSRVPVEEALAGVDDPRVRIVHHPRNLGLGRARNTALREARAPILAHLDSDDLWEPGYLEAMLPRLDDPVVGMAYCNVRVFGINEHDYITDPERHPVDRFPELAQRNPIPGFVTLRKRAVEQVGGYAEFAYGAMDWYLYMRLAASGWRFAYEDRILAHYRWTGQSMSQDWDKVQDSNLKVLASFMRHHPLVPGPRRQVAALALRQGAKRIPGVRRLKQAVAR